MGRNKKSSGAGATLALAAASLLFTVCFAVPNAGKIAEALFRLSVCAPLAVLRFPAAPETSVQPQAETETARSVPEEEPVPADILRLEADFRPDAVTPAGTVKERFYETDGATDLLGNIAVKNGTSLQPDFADLLARTPVFPSSAAEEPLVLVYHTHTTESYQRKDTGAYYTDGVTRSGNPDVNMVRIGEALCEALEQGGVSCTHDTGIYDEPYTGAYSRSRTGVRKRLEQYPSVRIALDVHRDAISDPGAVAVKPTARIEGRKTAQIMILTGAEDGSVADFPDWEKNLSFALCLQQKAQTMFPGLMRPLYFCPRKYNMDLVPCGLLLEVGSDANTLEEAYLAARLLGRALAALINENG